MSIDSSRPQPIFEQIADHVRRAVAAGVYRPGEPIPSLRAMALELTVNPNTVQRAYELLEREGLVVARKGIGMFVTEKGAAGARKQAERMVTASFAEGIRIGMSADIEQKEIRELFEQAWGETKRKGRIKK